MMKTSELDAAYRATCYRVFLPGGQCDLRIDQANQVLKAWLETAGAEKFAIVTAFNPGSAMAAPEQNAERQAQLECELLEGNYEPYAGENIPDDPDCPSEESCFVADLACDDACALAGEYGQNAIVYGGADAIPRLVWIKENEP